MKNKGKFHKMLNNKSNDKNVIYFHFLVSSKSSLYLRLAAIRPVL